MASQAIVEAVAVSEPIIEYLAVKTTLKVTKVYQGNLKVDELFDYYQDAMFVNGGLLNFKVPLYRKFTPFNIMQNGKKYIVFAESNELHPAYIEHLGRDVYRYANVILGVSYFESEMTTPPIINKQEMENRNIKYFDIKDYEFICYSKEQRNQINSFKKKMIERLPEGLS